MQVLDKGVLAPRLDHDVVDIGFNVATQLGRNIEAYIDNIVVKTRFQDSLVQDLHETFDNLHRVNFKL